MAQQDSFGVAAGLGLAAIGVLVILGAAVVHQALALPISEFPWRPAVQPGVATALTGALVARAFRAKSGAD